MPGNVVPEPPGCRPAPRLDTRLATGLIAAISAPALSAPGIAPQRRRSHEAPHRMVPPVGVDDTRTADDARRARGPDTARFARNAAVENHPGLGDPLLAGDTRYRDVLNTPR